MGLTAFRDISHHPGGRTRKENKEIYNKSVTGTNCSDQCRARHQRSLTPRFIARPVSLEKRQVWGSFSSPNSYTAPRLTQPASYAVCLAERTMWHSYAEGLRARLWRPIHGKGNRKMPDGPVDLTRVTEDDQARRLRCWAFTFTMWGASAIGCVPEIVTMLMETAPKRLRLRRNLHSPSHSGGAPGR